MTREPDRRRREDLLEDLLEHGSRNFRRYRRRAYFAFAILAAANVLAFVMIQRSRMETIRRACVEQNVRHDRTIRTLDQELAKLRETAPKRAARAVAGREGTLRLIESLAPKQDCANRAKRLTRP